MKQLWYRGWHGLCTWLYFERVTVLHPERLPGPGATLYIALHRNGAVDALICHRVAPRGVFLISTQLLRSFLSRLFFDGIAVARTAAEGDRSQNDAALRRCAQLLSEGGELIVFPEGTSSLGPRHLPFKSGAARIALDALARGVPLRVVPLGLHYERAWAFRSKVEVVVGEPVSTALPADGSDLERLKALKQRLTSALEAVGVNFASAEAQADAERLAYVATLGTAHRYYGVLKAFEAGVPEGLLRRWRDLEPQFAARRVVRHQGVPLFPVGPWLAYAALLLLLGPLLLAGALANLPPLAAGWLAARRCADDTNVITLWRILVGVPAAVLWFGLVAAGLALLGGWTWALGYALLTLGALRSCYRAKKLAVAVWNGLAHRCLARRAHEFHHAVLEALPRP